MGDMPTGRETNKTILVEREARPVGLARTENFLAQFPRAEVLEFAPEGKSE